MDERPNILLITSDQHRADCLGSAGHTCVRTPHLDQLAYEGTRFTRAFSDCPVCIPARTTLVTSIKSSTYGKPSYASGHRIERAREHFLGSILTNAGYQTALVGKRHWHTDPDFKAGFESVIPIERCKREQQLALGREGFTWGNGGNELNPSMSMVPPERYSTDWITDQSMTWLRERERDRPFFLWSSYVDPHPPFAIHEPYYSMYRDSPIPEPVTGDWVDGANCPLESRQHRLIFNSGPMGDDELRTARAVYYGMITNLDHQLGRIFGYLCKHGLWQNTLVIYTSDHGEMLGDHRDAAKSSFYNAAANLPFIVKAPASWGWQAGQENASLVEWADILPTLAATADTSTPDDIEGKDLRQAPAKPVRETLFGQIDESHMVRTSEWKYLYFCGRGDEQLFRDDDANDLHDVASEHPEVCEQLRNQLIERLTAIGSPHVEKGALLNRGLTEKPETDLKARNAAGWPRMGTTLEFHGEV